MKIGIVRKLAAIAAATAFFTSGTAYGAACYGNLNTANVWSEALYTDMSRLYGTSTKYSAWPGARSDHVSSVFAAISYETTKSVGQVFGEDCTDLLFSSIESTNDYKDYFVDPDRLLETDDIAQWNGFLFVVASGPKADVISQTVTFTYGSGETVTEDVARRSASSEAGLTGNDSYLYIYDISKGENYGKALVAKWHIDDIVGTSRNPFATFESVAVNDDYICLTVNNNTVSENKDYSYDRGIVVLKNNIERGKTGLAPIRADKETEYYSYGTKPIASYVDRPSIKNIEYDTAIIGNYYLAFPVSAQNMVDPKDMSMSAEGKIIAAYIGTTEDSGIGDKKSVFVSEMYDGDKYSMGTSLNEILPYAENKTWYDSKDAKINNLIIRGTEIDFLVTYKENVSGTEKSYSRIYVTDWSDPANPKYVTDYKYISPFGETGTMHYYEGYYYIPNDYGIEVVKKFGADGELSPEYITTYMYDSENWGTESKVGVFVTGNYMLVWNKYNVNNGYEGRMILEDDKSAVKEFCGYGRRNRFRAAEPNNIITYNDKVYLMSNSNLFDIMCSCVNVIDVSRAMPMSVTIDSIPKEVSLPYTVSGSCFGLDKVQISIDGVAAGYAEAKKMESGDYRWQYTVTQEGAHTISAAGVPFGDTVIAATADYAAYIGVSSGNVSLNGSYSESGGSLAINAEVSNSGSTDVEGRLIVGIYKENTLYSLEISDTVTVPAGGRALINNMHIELPAFLGNYEVKGFFLGGKGGFAPYSAVKIFTN